MRNKAVVMTNLIGEQAAPNLLPVYELKPQRIFLITTERTKSVAERLKRLLEKKKYQTEIVLGAAYNVEETALQIQTRLRKMQSINNYSLVGNFTGGTKPMVLALIRALQNASQRAQLCYFRTEGTQGVLYFYDPKTLHQIDAPRSITSTLTLDDYLLAYLDKYHFTGFGPEPGKFFEEAVVTALEPVVDELKVGLKKGGALDIDLIFRCGNQVGIAEVKTGNKVSTNSTLLADVNSLAYT